MINRKDHYANSLGFPHGDHSIHLKSILNLCYLQLGNGLDVIHAELLPEDKARIIKEFKKEVPTAVIGDGINDAPALATNLFGLALTMLLKFRTCSNKPDTDIKVMPVHVEKFKKPDNKPCRKREQIGRRQCPKE
ncbi:hypothetical protein V6N13_149687 [Hibiscus sabdariffa]